MHTLEKVLTDARWRQELAAEFEQPYMKELSDFVCAERRQGVEIYPPRHQVFNAFNQTPFDQVKVLIMGQDPYHGPGQAEGLCFSVAPGVATPPSLRNIIKELEKDVGTRPPQCGSLSRWCQQGVLLLNATLTVRRGQAKSHYGHGWERFTDAAVECVARRQDPVVFILWGRSARDKIEHILRAVEGAQRRHLVLTSAHPSPLSAHNGFFGSAPFSRANAFLQQVGKAPIDWQIP